MGRLVGQYIEIHYNDWYVKSVAEMVFEHYNKPEYENTAFLIDEWFDTEVDPKYTRVIFYNLEHYEYTWCECDFENYIPPNATEVWEFDINNMQYYKEAGVKIPAKFMPLRFTTRIRNTAPKPDNPKFDLGFVGLFSKIYHTHRIHLLEDLSDMFSSPNLRWTTWGMSVNIIFGRHISEILPELNNCKFVLDSMSQKPAGYVAQNQVRIFEHIIYGHHVLSEDVNGINYFPGLITQFYFPREEDRSQLMYTTYADHLVNLMKTVIPQDFSQKYKEMTYTDEAYETYKQHIINEYNTNFNKNYAGNNQ